MKRWLFSLVVGVAACSDPPAKEDPPTEVGDACNGDDLCDKGQACLTLNDDEDGTCQALPDGCVDCGDCETGDLCPDGSIGNSCFSIFSRALVSCQLPDEGGEGEGEGEGE